VSAKEGKDERAVKRDKEGRKPNKEESEWVQLCGRVQEIEGGTGTKVVKSEIQQQMGKMRMKCSGWRDVADSRRGGGGLVPNGSRSSENSEQGQRRGSCATSTRTLAAAVRRSTGESVQGFQGGALTWAC